MEQSEPQIIVVRYKNRTYEFVVSDIGTFDALEGAKALIDLHRETTKD